MATQDNFKVNPTVFLGLDYAEFQNEMYAVLLSKTAEYYATRRLVLQKVKADAIRNIYEVFFQLLSEGTIAGEKLFKDVAGNYIEPKYPTQKISEISLSAAKTLDSICNEVIEILLPEEFDVAAAKRLKKIGEASRLQD